MQGFTGPELAQLLDVGCLIVSEKSKCNQLAEVLEHNSHIPQVQMMKHWLNAVMIIISVESEGASDGDDGIVAVNITRPVELNDPSMEADALGSAAGCLERVDIMHHIGGPCMDSCVTSLTLLHATHPDEVAQIPALRVGGNQGGLWVVGTLEHVCHAAYRDVQRREPETKALVKAFWGTAGWSRTQLLGELARQSWGMCRAEAADIFPKEAQVHTTAGQSAAPPGGWPDWDEIWESLVDGEPNRLLYAPVNEMCDSDGDEEEDEMSPEEQDAAARELNDKMAEHREQLKRQLLAQQAQEQARNSTVANDDNL